MTAIQHRWFAPHTMPGEPPWARTARDPRLWKRLQFLSHLLGDSGELVPTAVRGSSLERVSGSASSRAVQAVPDEAKAWYLALSLSSSTTSRPRARALQALQEAAVRGDDRFTQRFVEEIERFFRLCLEPHWPVIEEQAEEDILCRAGVIAKRGLAHCLASLHPSVSYRDGTLCVANDTELNSAYDREIALVPSTLATRCFLALDHRAGYRLCLVYPALRPSGGGGRPRTPQRAGEVLSEVLGHTRLMLLSSLDRPFTTTRLAAVHHLSPSTVSYHLTRLYRAGLLTRMRDGSSVRYQRTGEADRLLAHAM
ncbi:helix-turn-helix domain-containing protein [Streptomyces sp. NPDC047049]|uniref:ArsR/SmtB family transcription factor n=1 Tax=Streptomyces sp. NPDC047049 TaxID=3156688 RepID=UPI0033F239B9